MQRFLNLDLQLDQARLRRWGGQLSQPHRGGNVRHPGVVEIAWVDSGTVHYSAHEKRFVVRAGEGLILPSAEAHATQFVGAFSGTGLWVDDKLIEEAIGRGRPLRRPRLLAQGSAIAKLGAVIACEAHHDRDEPLLQALIDALVQRVVASLADQPLVPPATAIDQVHACLERIRKCFQDPLSVNQLASELGLSRFQLNRRFFQLTGDSPYRLLLRTRLRYAKAALQAGAPVTRAAFDAGFNDLSRFSRMFRREYGIAPGKLRTRRN